MVQEGWAMFREGSETVRTWLENVPRWSWNSQEMVWNRKDMVWIGNESVRKMWALVWKWSKKWSKIARKWSGIGLKWSEMSWNCLKLCHGPTLSKMIQDGSLWSKMFQDSKMVKRCLKHTYVLSVDGAQAGGKKKKRPTILPISLVQSFFCVLFFSFCSNLSIWPGRQDVPDESRCYIPIFDGLVYIYLRTHKCKIFTPQIAVV